MYSLRAFTRLTRNLQKLNLTSQVQLQSQRHIARWMHPTLKELTKRKKRQKPEDRIDNPRNKYIEWNREAELYAFNVRLSEKFDSELLEQAFTNRSYIIKEEEEQKKVGIEDPQIDLEDNRELIEEGREVVHITVENYLSQALPYAPQECIQALKDYLTSTKTLAKTSKGIGAKDLILTSEYPVDEETLANTFYALTSALKRSVDLEHAGVFVRDILISLLADQEIASLWCPEDDAINILNDILRQEGRELAEPRIIAQTGMKTLIPVYSIGVYSNKEFLGSGFGETIEEATKTAALNALFKMFKISDSSKPFQCNLKLDHQSASNSLPSSEWSRLKLKN